MNTSQQNPENTTRPFGYWLKAVDRLMAAEFAAAFDREGDEVGRRDWRLLNVVDGTMPARRPLNEHKLHRLIERGWVIADGDGDGWTLTDDGRAAKDRLGAIVDGIRAKVTGAVSEDELATTLASLEKIARAFGWYEETPLPRSRRHGFGPRGRFGKHAGPRHGFGRRHGFGPGFGPGRGFGPGHGFGPGRGFGPGHGFGPEHGFGPDADGERDFGPRHDFGPGHGFGPRHGSGHDGDCGHGSHGSHGSHGERGHGPHAHGDRRGHGPHRAARLAQHAYERGFDAGFSRGRDA
ncbi:hypothetical protein ACTJKK_09655 [Microbacterium sp. 22179]|uniref:hypothetical protein n=1 Tax=Microbacterium sp. 22179 TaxID=3453886 RepID=UPI003F86CCC1